MLKNLSCSLEPLAAGDFARLYDQDQNGELHRDELGKSGRLDEFVSRFILTGSPEVLSEYLGKTHAMDAALKDTIRERLGKIQDGDKGELRDCLDAEDLARVSKWLVKEFSSGWLRADVSAGFRYERNKTVLDTEFTVTGQETFTQDIRLVDNLYRVPGKLALSGTLLKGRFRLEGGVEASLRGEWANSTGTLEMHDGTGLLLGAESLLEKRPSFGYEVTPEFVLAKRDGKFSLTLDGRLQGSTNPIPNAVSFKGRTGGTLRWNPSFKKTGFSFLLSGAYHNDDYAAPNVEGHLNRDDAGGSARAEVGVQPSKEFGAALSYDFAGSNVTHALDHSRINNHTVNLAWQITPAIKAGTGRKPSFQFRGRIEGAINSVDAEYINGLLPLSTQERRLGFAPTLSSQLFKDVNMDLTLAIGGASLRGSVSGPLITSRQSAKIRFTPKNFSFDLGITHSSESGELYTEEQQEVLRQKDDYILSLNARFSPRDFFEASLFSYLHNQQEEGFQADRSMTVASFGGAADWRLLSSRKADLWLGADLGYERYLDENRYIPATDVANDHFYAGLNLELRGLKLAGQK